MGVLDLVRYADTFPPNPIRSALADMFPPLPLSDSFR